MKITYALLLASGTHLQGYTCWGQTGSGTGRIDTFRQTHQPPQSFVPYLKSHPGDQAALSSALIWYDRRVNNPKQLQVYTFQMIQYHPANFYIRYENTAAFYAAPGYRAQVIARLEKQIHNGHKETGTYLNLALICEQGALPPVSNDANKRKQFLQYMALPQGTVLRQTTDKPLARKAQQYYQLVLQEGGKQGDTAAVTEASAGLKRLQKRLNEK